MLITQAQKALEQNKEKYVLLKNNPQWDYLAIKIGDSTYRMLFERVDVYNVDVCRQWSIDECTETQVYSKYWEGYVSMDCSQGMCGVRDFEFSIVFETLWKPMGIPLDVFRNRKLPWSMYASELKSILKELGISYTVIAEGTF